MKPKCYKSVSARFRLSTQQEKHFLKNMFNRYSQLLIRLVLHGYEGRDDDLHAEIGGKLSEAEFRDICGELRRGVLCTAKEKTGEFDDKGKPKKRSLKTTSRALAAPLFSTNSSVGKSTCRCREPLKKLRAGGVLPFEFPGSRVEQYSVVEGMIEFIRSYVACDQKTRENYREETEHLRQLKAAKIRELVDAEDEDPENRDDKSYVGIRRKMKKLVKKKRAKNLPEALDQLIEKQTKKLNRIKSEARVSIPQPERPLAYRLGSNFVDYRFTVEGPKIILDILQGALKGRYELTYGATNRRGEYLLQQLEATQIEATTTQYLLRYKENGKRYREALLKEPRINYRNNGFYLDMPVGIDADLPNCFKGQHCAFGRHYPKAVTTPSSMRILGVDLNIDPVVAWAVMDADDFKAGRATSVRVGKTGTCYRTATSDPFKDLMYRCKDLKWILKNCIGARTRGRTMRQHLKNFRKPDNFLRAVQKFYPEPDVLFEEVERLPLETRIGEADQKPYCSVRLWRTAGFTLGEHMLELFKEYKQLKHMRCTAYTDNVGDNLQWLDLLMKLTSLKQAWHTMGGRSEEKPENGDLLETLHKQKGRCRIDNRKKMCRVVVDTALQQNCDLIAIENLERESRADNSLWDLWSPLSMQTLLTEMAQADGIGVVRVQPDCTSKTIYGTWEAGYRDPKNRRHIFYEDNGQVVSADVDINAALNIAHLAATRHEYPLYFWVRKNNGRVVPLEKQTKDQQEAHEARVKALFGNCRCWQHLADDITEKPTKIYRYQDTWITSEQRDRIHARVQERAKKEEVA